MILRLLGEPSCHHDVSRLATPFNRAITELPSRIFRRGLILRFTTLVMSELAGIAALRAPSTNAVLTALLPAPCND